MSTQNSIKQRLNDIKPGIEFQLSYSCPMTWENLDETTNERCRHCSKCDLNVYDLVGLTTQEIGQLVEDHGGEICGQAYFRSDNSLSLEPCKYPRRLLRGKIRPKVR